MGSRVVVEGFDLWFGARGREKLRSWLEKEDFLGVITRGKVGAVVLVGLAGIRGRSVAERRGTEVNDMTFRKDG